MLKLSSNQLKTMNRKAIILITILMWMDKARIRVLLILIIKIIMASYQMIADYLCFNMIKAKNIITYDWCHHNIYINII
jgi:hypothetical protein